MSWLASLKTIHAALFVVLLLYLAMVGANTFGFGYSFWNDPPPSGAAETFAFTSIWVFFASAAFVGAVTYTWLCAHELHPNAPLGDALRAAFRAIARRWVPATLGFAATALACFFLVPGPFLVAWLAGQPVQRLRKDGWGGEAPPEDDGAVSPLETGLRVAALVAAPSWLALRLGFAIADNWDGYVEALAALIAYGAVIVAGLAAGWAARQASRAS